MKFHIINIIKTTFLLCGFFIIGCGSGEYEVDEYEVNTIEKTLKADTIKTIVQDDQIKDDKTKDDQIKDDKKDSYNYIVQIGAFMVKSYFDNFFERAKQVVGPEVYFEFLNGLYKARIGNYTIRAEAILMIDRVRALGYTDAFIITRKK